MYYAKDCNIAFFQQKNLFPSIEIQGQEWCGMVNAIMGTVQGIETSLWPSSEGRFLNIYTLIFIFTIAYTLATEELFP